MMYAPNPHADLLFGQNDIQEVFQQQKTHMLKELDSINADRFLNTAPADLKQYFADKYSLDMPILRKEDISADYYETKIDVRNDHSRFVIDRNRPCLIHGQRIEIDIPVDGDIQLLKARPNPYSLNPPRGKLVGSCLRITFDVPNDSHEDIQKKLDTTINQVESNLKSLQNNITQSNHSLASVAEQAINARRERVLANQNRVIALGIPLRKKSDSPQTYALPEIRRKVVPSMPPATSVPYEPEPVLDSENYEYILKVIQNMTHVIERSPSAFQSMGEEDLRQHFLVQLNGQFEGGVTGETFNVNGKTDILLRHNDRNVFIAECKFWKGPKQYRQTIDQLLGYKAWRDTKTAIIVFNRGTAMSTVLAGIDKESTSHANYKRTENWRHESGFRYIFHHSDDPNREFVLTVLVFDVPAQ